MLSKVVNKKPHKWRFKFFTENYAFEKILDFLNYEIEIQSYSRDKQAELKFFIFRENGRSPSAQRTPSKGIEIENGEVGTFYIENSNI